LVIAFFERQKFSDIRGTADCTPDLARLDVALCALLD
jgi:hypothetical protein